MKACSEHVEISVAVSTMLHCAYTESCGHPAVMWLVNQISRAVTAQQSHVGFSALHLAWICMLISASFWPVSENI